MSHCNGNCQKPGSGTFAGNDACQIQTASRKAQDLAAKTGGTVGYVSEAGSAVPYITNRVNVESMIPVIPILSGAAAFSGGIYADKVARGEVVKPAKTDVGKFLGSLTGRNKAAELSAAQSSAPISNEVSKNLQRQGYPVSGSVLFGNASQNQVLKVLGIVAGTIVAIFYFVTRKPKRRRR